MPVLMICIGLKATPMNDYEIEPLDTDYFAGY